MLNDETKTVLWDYTVALGMLEAGEKRVIAGNAATDMTAWYAYMERYKTDNPRNITSYNASLIFDTMVLDEWK